MRKETLLRLLNRFGMSATLILLGLILLVAPDSAAVIIAYLMGRILLRMGPAVALHCAM